MMDEMDEVFQEAKAKAVSRIEKKGNTATPWKDFEYKWLDKRLHDEIQEYDKSKTVTELKDELLDIINLATFNYLAIKDFHD